jgi:hypothetical protein
MSGSDIYVQMGFGDVANRSRDKHKKPGWKRVNALSEVQLDPRFLRELSQSIVCEVTRQASR